MTAAALCAAALLGFGPPALNPDISAKVIRNAGPGYDDIVTAQGAVIHSDNTGHGAVLCMWGVMSGLRYAGEQCHAHEDATFRQALSTSVARIEAFILRNAHHPAFTQTNLDERRRIGLEQLRAQGPVCTGYAEEAYRKMRTLGPAMIERSTEDLLSIPREPVMAPCF